MRENILWDLDGTLTNPRHGIVRSVQYALEKAALPIPSEEELLWVIGPPLHVSFARLAPEAGEKGVWDLVEKYRERYAAIGMYENEVYAGIPELLQSLSHKRHFLATSKAEIFAQEILRYFQLANFFQRAYGSELDGRRSEKGELIRYILESERISPHEAVMVGDRKFDILGAKQAGISCVGISWGYGSPEELREAGADIIAHSPEELGALLTGKKY